MAASLKFGLSRSLGRQASFDRARDFAAALDRVGFSSVVPFGTYRHLEDALLSGAVAAAWAPPMICARVERAGGIIVLRALRGGLPTYGSALLRDVHYRFDLSMLSEMKGLRAAWVDTQSMAGYLLPRHALTAAGVVIEDVFVEEQLLGSYRACLSAVLCGKADLTACFYAGSDEAPHYGHQDLLGNRSRLLEVIGRSQPGPHDGVALSPALLPAARDQLAELFHQLAEGDRDVLAESFRAEGFDTPPPDYYRDALAQLDLIASPLEP